MAALRGPEIAELQTALLSAFKRSSLVVMVRTQLNADLDTIAGGDTFDIVVFELIAWAEKHGRTEDLIQGAYACNPQNPQLQQFVHAHNRKPPPQATADPAPEPPNPESPKSHRLPFAALGALTLVVLSAAAITVFGRPPFWPSLASSLASAFSPAAQIEPEPKLDAAKIRFVVTRENGDINQYPAGRVMRVAPGSALLIEVEFADDASFAHELAYHYFAVRGSVQATNQGLTASYVAPLQPGTDILSVEIMRPHDPFKMTRSLYIWVSE